MIFYKKITICNMFAYYGEQTIEFQKNDSKPLYLIYGRNGFGKTSFISSLKLLFLGSGLLNDSSKVPAPILNGIEKGRGKFHSKQLLLGTSVDNLETKWGGVLNKTAVEEGKNEFYVELVLQKDNKEITIKRYWKRFPNLEERLIVKFDGNKFEDCEATDKLESIFPTKFIEFFIFNGEMIGELAEDMERELKEKIQDMLNITILDKLIKQIKTTKEQLQNGLKEYSNEKAELYTKKGDLGACNECIKYLDDQIKNLSTDKEWIENELRNKNDVRDNHIISSGREQERYLNLKNKEEENINSFKDSIKNYGGEILFLKLDDFFSDFFSDLENSQIGSNLDPEMLKELCAFSAEYLFKEYQIDRDTSSLALKLNEAFNKFTQNSDDNKTYRGIGNLNTLKTLYNGLNSELNLLSNAIVEHKNSEQKFKEYNELLNQYLVDNEAKKIIDKVADEIEKLQAELSEKTKKIEDNKNELREKQELQNNLEMRIKYLDEKIGQDHRISDQFKMAQELEKIILQYKDKRIERVASCLKDRVYENYQKLLPDDNVASVEIKDFNIYLKDIKNEIIPVANQSAGQKQIAAISIFWALSELSDRNLPLIIDTPLARIDNLNRKSIIQNYYFNASNQVIVLPTDSEFGTNEYEIAKDKIAQFYQIENDISRKSARIVKSSIKNIIGDSDGE